MEFSLPGPLTNNEIAYGWPPYRHELIKGSVCRTIASGHYAVNGADTPDTSVYGIGCDAEHNPPERCGGSQTQSQVLPGSGIQMAIHVAAVILGLSEHHTSRMLGVSREESAAALAHGNRGMSLVTPSQRRHGSGWSP